MSITEIVMALPSILSYFVPGSIFLYLYNYFSIRKTIFNGDTIIWCVVVSYCIKSAVDLVDSWISINDGLPIIWCYVAYLCTAIVLAILAKVILFTQKMQNFLGSTLGVTLTNNVWMNTVDFVQGCTLVVTLKDGNRYMGAASFIDEEWIVLRYYVKFGNSPDSISDGSQVIAIPVDQISHFEVRYKENSTYIKK